MVCSHYKCIYLEQILVGLLGGKMTQEIAIQPWKLTVILPQIPAYAAYKLVPMAMSYFGKGGSKAVTAEEDKAEGKSKRQAKMEKRANKGQAQVKYAR